jgi:hypothetical protein
MILLTIICLNGEIRRHNTSNNNNDKVYYSKRKSQTRNDWITFKTQFHFYTLRHFWSKLTLVLLNWIPKLILMTVSLKD